MGTPTSSPRDLDPVLRWMQAVIMHPAGVEAGLAEARRHIDVGPGEAEAVVNRSRALTAVERLAIYGNAYYARLLECLREEFAVLAHALGEELFGVFAVGYLQRYPSRSYTLAQLGADFPRYLAETRPGSGPAGWEDFIVDLATLERTFNEVFDGPGVEGERLPDLRQFADMPAEQFLGARLVPVPCLRLLALHYPVQRYYTAVRRRKRPRLPAAAPTYLALSRQDYRVRHYELSRPAYLLLQALLAGDRVGQAIAKASAAAGPEAGHLAGHLYSWFRDWAAEGFFHRIDVTAGRRR